MDAVKCKMLADLCDDLTTSGEPRLDQTKLKDLKRICRTSDEYVSQCFELLWSQLKREHAEIRLSTFQVIDELFRRSHKFRQLLLDNFQTYLELTLEINLDFPLPLPKKAAETLKNSAYQALRNWHETYSSGYRKLGLAYNYLRNCHQVDFNKADHMSALQRQREQEAKLKVEAQRQKSIEKVVGHINEHEEDIRGLVLQLSTCFKLLIPSQDVFDVFDDHLFSSTTTKSQPVTEGGEGKDHPSQSTQIIAEETCSGTSQDDSNGRDGDATADRSEDATADRSEDATGDRGEDAGGDALQNHGLLNRKSNININLNQYRTVRECEDNTDIIHNLDELKVLLTVKYLPMLVQWLSILQKNGASQSLLTKLIDLKQSIQKSLKDLDLLSIYRIHGDDSDSDDDDLVEIPEEVDEVTFFKSKLGMTGKPSASTSDSNQPSTSKDLRQSAPVLSYDLDLKYWENPDELTIPESVVNDLSSYVMLNEKNYTSNTGLLDLYSSRKIEFTGRFVPVKWKCRAPLATGRLCPRMDRVKCPFHGPIIARNDDGTPANPADAAKFEKILEKQRKENPDWQDPSLIADIKSQTGVDLKVKPTRGKPQRSKLTNINKVEKTPRNRLESKVLSRRAIKRVAGALNNLQNKRLRDKFCHSFNSTFGY